MVLTSVSSKVICEVLPPMGSKACFSVAVVTTGPPRGSPGMLGTGTLLYSSTTLSSRDVYALMFW